MDESDEELVRQTDKEEEEEGEVAGTGSASSNSSSSVYLRGPAVMSRLSEVGPAYI